MTDPGPARDDPHEIAIGWRYGVMAYAWWGLVFPFHLKWLTEAAPDGVTEGGAWWPSEILAHRVLWALIFCFGLLTWLKRWGQLGTALRSRKTLSILLLTASLVSVNWLVFIYAVAEGQLYRASLGYFVTPLVNVILGMLFLGERLRGAQWPAIALAAAGMAWLVLGAGGFPWIELSLAVSFGFYGLVRKKASVGPIVGLTVETAVLAPVGVAFLVFLGLGVGPAAGRETGFETGGPLTVTLLVLSGLSTALPLLWFAAAAKRLPLVSIGFLQFSAPTGQFLLGVLLFDEVVPDRNWLGYALIWAGVSWFAGESYLAARRRRIAIAPGPAPE